MTTGSVYYDDYCICKFHPHTRGRDGDAALVSVCLVGLSFRPGGNNHTIQDEAGDSGLSGPEKNSHLLHCPAILWDGSTQ